MDVLSEILSSVRSVAPLVADLRMSGVWGIDMEEGGSGVPFHYVAFGTCWLQSDNEWTRLKQGDLVIVPGWNRHTLASEVGAPIRPIREIVSELGYPLWTAETGIEMPIGIGSETRYDVEILSGIFGFDSKNAAFMTEALPPIMRLKGRSTNLSIWLDALISLVRGEQGRLNPGFSAVAGRAMELIFIHAVRTWILDLDQPTGWLRGVLDPKIGKALRAIHGSPAKNWSLEQLATLAGQSRSVFANRFRSILGETPFGYLARWRMIQAADRLLNTKDSVFTIASKLGYGSASALARAFHGKYGCSPAEFRNNPTRDQTQKGFG